MHRYSLSILVLISFIPNISMSADYEKREMTRCMSKANSNPTNIAICAGKTLTDSQIDNCIENGCLDHSNEIKQAFTSLYKSKFRQKQSCGNIYINSTYGQTTEFYPDKTWKLCSGYKVSFQKDGNLVVYNRSGKALWSSGTNNKGADRLSLNANGDLVIYRKVYPIWSAGTHGNPGATLAVQEDGNLAIYNRRSKPVWATGTHGQ